MKNEIRVVIATFFTAIAQLSFKIGGSEQGFFIGPFPLNLTIIIGFIAYGISALLFLFALRGGHLSLLYPIWSLSFVWIFFVSSYMLNETITVMNWLGVFLIMAGVYFVGKGSSDA